MMEVSAGAELKIMPQSELEEVAQNVQMIISTYKSTVPLDREFGTKTAMLDKPIAASQAKMAAEIVKAVHKFEPRAVVTEVNFSASGSELAPLIKFKLKKAQ